MRHSPRIALIGAMVFAVAGMAAGPSALGKAHDRAAASCDRDCLIDMMNRYVDAMVVQRDPGVLPVSPSLKATENGQPTKLGEGLWKTALAVPYRQIFADAKTGQVGLYAVANENGPLTIFSVRLKVVGGRIAESETLYARKGDAPAFAPEAMVTPDPLYDEVVPLKKRTPRATMIAAAQAYYDGIEKADGSKVPAAAGCYRVENGLQSYRVPSLVVILHCNAGLKLFSYVKPVRDRRFPLVDEEHGLVWALIVMDTQPGAARPGADGQPGRASPGGSLFVQELYKIVDGRTRRMEVVMRSMPYGSPTGWPVDPRP